MARIGTVKAVRSTDLLVDRRLARDIDVPFDAIAAVGGERVTLTRPAAEVNARDWTNPPLVG